MASISRQTYFVSLVGCVGAEVVVKVEQPSLPYLEVLPDGGISIPNGSDDRRNVILLDSGSWNVDDLDVCTGEGRAVLWALVLTFHSLASSSIVKEADARLKDRLGDVGSDDEMGKNAFNNDASWYQRRTG